jgi:hypothetical protein
MARAGRAGNNIRIPLREDEALKLLLKVKPTVDMPRPGAKPTEKKNRTKPAK